MLVREVMTSPAVTIGPGATVREAIRVLERFSITALPVATGNGHLVGVISEADLLHEALEHDQRAHMRRTSPGTESPGLLVQDVMTSQVVTVSADSDLADAAELMEDTVIKSLPVVLHDRVVGVISRRDIIATLARDDRDIGREVDELVRLAGKDWLITVEDGVLSIDGPCTESDERMARALVGSVRGVSAIRLNATSG